jgi:hypothetical protein
MDEQTIYQNVASLPQPADLAVIVMPPEIVTSSLIGELGEEACARR